MAFTNSPLASYVRISPSKDSPRNKPITKVTWHHMAGVCSVETFGNIVANPDREMSATYAIGSDARVGRYLDESDRPWTSCSPSNDNQAVTIEISNCEFGEPWRVSDEVFNKAIDLTVDICKRNGIKQLTYTGDENGSLTFHRFYTSTSCLPINRTELLTPSGWKLLKDIKIGDVVASAHIDDLSISFTTVENVVPVRSQDTYVTRDFEATSDHRIVYYNQSGKQNIGVFKDIYDKPGSLYLPNAGRYKGSGMPLTNDEIEFLVATQADGHYMRDDKSKYCLYGIEFHLQKQRKIDRLKTLMDSLGFDYRTCNQSNGTTKLRVYGCSYVNWCEKYLHNKRFTWNWLCLSPAQAEFFLDVIMLYDGCLSNCSYSSSIIENSDIVQAISAINGVGSKMYDGRVYLKKDKRSLGDNYRVRKPRQLVSCVTVQSGFILIRQHGRTTITGNCPGTYLFSRANDICRLVNAKLGMQINTSTAPQQQSSTSFKVGSLVSVTGNASYYDGGTVPSWVKSQKWYIAYLTGDRAVLGKNQTGDQDIQSPISTKFLCMNGVASSTSTSNTLKAYTVQLRGVDTVFTDGTGSKSKGTIGGSGGVFTIIAEQTTNGVVYGKLKSGIGWVKVGQKPNVVKPDNTIHVGDSVVVLKNVQYTGETFALYTSHYKVLELNGDRAVISADGVNVTAAVNINNLRK